MKRDGKKEGRVYVILPYEVYEGLAKEAEQVNNSMSAVAAIGIVHYLKHKNILKQERNYFK